MNYRYYLSLSLRGIAVQFVTVCAFLLFVTHAAAQYRFESWTTDNGLPQNGLRGIAQTPDGYLWFTTFDGLVRFDGAKFTVFDKNNTPVFPSNRFSQLAIDREGTLFAATEDGELIVYRNGRFTTARAGAGPSFAPIADFDADVRGDLYLATDRGNYYYRDGKLEPAPNENIPNDRRFYASPSGNLWLYDAGGITQMTPDRRQIRYPLKFRLYNDYFSGLKLFEDSRGTLWCGDLNGVYALHDGAIKTFTVAEGVPANMGLRPFVEDTDGSIWFATAVPWQQGAGLVRYADGKFTVWGKAAGLSSLLVSEVFKDREGNIWVTTDHGLNRLQKQFIHSYSTNDGLAYPEVYPLLRSRSGDIFVGTTQGVSRYHEGRFTDEITRGNDGGFLLIQSLHEDDRGRLWIGVSGNLFIWANPKLTAFPGFDRKTPQAIVADRAGNIWVAAGGLYQIRNDKLVAHYETKDGLPSNDVKFLFEDRNGTLWAGTYGGLAKFDGTRFVAYTARDGLASDQVRTIYEDKEGTLWVSTYDGGLSRFSNGKFFNFTVANGLFNNGVFQIMEDARANFWISCNKGIYRVNRLELNAVAAGQAAKVNSVAYGKQDGMLNTECNGGRQPAGVPTADGRFWFPTQEGVVVIDPAGMTFNAHPPPVQIEQVLVGRNLVIPQDGISLRANNDNLEIRFTGISFTKPDQVKFRYRIEGLSDSWTDVGTIREVYFPSLPAGEYTFHVIAANADGVWNNEGAYLKIHVRAPFWRRTWFIVLCSIAGLGVVFGFFWLRDRRHRRREQLQQEFSRRLLESQEHERKRFASEMHDSLGQYLLAIKNWALFGLNSLPKENPAREHLGEISETSTIALAEVREIAHNLRPYQLERLGLTNTLEYLVKNIRQTTSITVETEIENIDGALPPDAEILFYRIVQECLTNVLKHSGAENAWLAVKKVTDTIEFVCRDDGKGFDPEHARQSTNSGLGLNGIIERVRILGGTYRIEAEAGRGTTITVIIPVAERANQN
jgi:signal transduction histidine kinase/ligand-binding sensor domain-containing protein